MAEVPVVGVWFASLYEVTGLYFQVESKIMRHLMSTATVRNALRETTVKGFQKRLLLSTKILAVDIVWIIFLVGAGIVVSVESLVLL